MSGGRKFLIVPLAPFAIGAAFAAQWLLAKTTVVLIAVAPTSVSVGELAYHDMAAHTQKFVDVPAGDTKVTWKNGKSVVVIAPHGGGFSVVPGPGGCAVRFDDRKKPAALLEIGAPGAVVSVDKGTVVGVVGCDKVSEPPALLYARLDDVTAVRR